MPPDGIRVQSPTFDSTDQFVAELIVSHRRDEVYLCAVVMKVVSDVEWCASRKQSDRQKIPQDLTETE